MPRTVRLILMLAITLALTVEARAGAVITRVSDGQSVTLSQLSAAAERADLIMIGEVHDNPKHHDMQLAVIRSLWEKKVPLAIAVEMFDAGSQQILDDWTDGKTSEERFRDIYAKNWSYQWPLYRDIFIFARDNRIPMIGINIPKDIATKVSRQGYASLTPEEKKVLPPGTSCDLNNPYTAFLEKSFKEVFKRVTNGRIFTFFCEAQTVRNSAMAMNIASYQKKRPDAKIVAVTGVWHAVRNAVPEQLRRHDSKQASLVILPAIAELNQSNAATDVVDYIITQ